MTPKEKANEIVERFMDYVDHNSYTYLNANQNAKQCALMMVQEIICSNPHSNPFNTNVTSTFEYWQNVKEEVKKLPA